MEEKNKVKLGTLDKYISTTNIVLHIIGITVATMIIMIGTLVLNQNYLQILFLIGTVLMIALMYLAYSISKKSKIKKNKLNQHKIKFVWQYVYILGSIVWMCALAMLSGIGYVFVITK